MINFTELRYSCLRFFNPQGAVALARKDVQKRVIHVLREQLLEGDKVTTIGPETALDTLDIDSLDAVTIGLSLEDTFGIDIRDEDISTPKTVLDIIRLVEQKIGVN